MSIFKEYLSDFVKDETKLRNPILTINGLELGLIGDVHVGQTFRTGVPKNRLGEREAFVLSEFKRLLKRDVPYTFVVGDLLHKIRISNNALYQLITIIEEVSKEKPHQQIYILNGNHDMAKEVDRVSSFQLLEKYFNALDLKNLHLVSTHSADNIIRIPEKDLLIYCSHYNPFESLDTELESLGLLLEEDLKFGSRIALGHWETIDFGSDHHIDRNVPEIVLKQFNMVITGHEHKPKLSLIEDVPVLTTGSMQPYAFGEELESESNFYCSLNSASIMKALEENPDIFENSYVRILVQDGDELPPEFKCLGRTYKNVKILKETKESKEDFNESPLSFQVTFLNHLKAITTEENKDILSNIERVYLDRSYKETM